MNIAVTVLFVGIFIFLWFGFFKEYDSTKEVKKHEDDNKD